MPILPLAPHAAMPHVSVTCHAIVYRAVQGTVLYDSLGRIISEAYFSTKTDEELQRLVLAAAFGRAELEPGHVPTVTTVNYARFLDVSRTEICIHAET